MFIITVKNKKISLFWFSFTNNWWTLRSSRMSAFNATLFTHFLALVILILFICFLIIIVITFSWKSRFELINFTVNTSCTFVGTVWCNMTRFVTSVTNYLSLILCAGVVTLIIIVSVVTGTVTFIRWCATFLIIIIIVLCFWTTALVVLFPCTTAVFLVFVEFVCEIWSTIIVIVIIIGKWWIIITVVWIWVIAAIVTVHIWLSIWVSIVIIVLLSEIIDLFIAAWRQTNFNTSCLWLLEIQLNIHILNNFSLLCSDFNHIATTSSTLFISLFYLTDIGW